MDNLKFGDIVLLEFPYTNIKNSKKRPAMVICDYNDGDIIVCRITSKIYISKNDVFIENWENTGLKLPSVIRVHKLATLEKNMILTEMGTIDNKTKDQVKLLFSKLAE